MTTFYNEFDPKPAEWIHQLTLAGELPPGHVSTTSITDLSPDELRPYDTCHFFAGIGGWAEALRLADWPPDRPVWTGSCPCQPLSCAGKQKGHADARHLWPAFHRLIAECRPATIFGEQVASAIGREWLAGVRADLEDLGYAVGAADLCAAGVGAPHIRQRLFWVAHAESQGRSRVEPERKSGFGQRARVGREGATSRLEHPEGDGREQRRSESSGRGVAGGCGAGRLADTVRERRCGGEPRRKDAEDARQPGEARFWDAYELLPCTDGKTRRIEPGSFPLAHGIPDRVGLLRGYGNAIVPQVAAAFIQSFVS